MRIPLPQTPRNRLSPTDCARCRGKGDARPGVGWAPGREVRVANIQETTLDKADCGWLELYLKYTQANEALLECAAKDCKTPRRGVLGAHVWVEGLPFGRIAAIAPFCSGHNNCQGEFRFPAAIPLRRGAEGGRLMLMPAHECYQGAALAGAACLDRA